MENSFEKLYEASEDILDITELLKEYCSANHDTQELRCIYACVKLLNKMADNLTFNMEELLKECSNKDI